MKRHYQGHSTMRNPETDKNNMPNPPGSEPVVNRVINPAAGIQEQPGAAPPAQPHNPIRMNPLEQIGVNNLINEFRRTYENNFAPFFGNPQNQQSLEAAMYWICREVETLRMLGHNPANILGSDNLIRRMALAAYNGTRANGDAQANFEQLPFMTQMYYMNMSIFVARFLNN